MDLHPPSPRGHPHSGLAPQPARTHADGPYRSGTEVGEGRNNRLKSTQDSKVYLSGESINEVGTTNSRTVDQREANPPTQPLPLHACRLLDTFYAILLPLYGSHNASCNCNILRHASTKSRTKARTQTHFRSNSHARLHARASEQASVDTHTQHTHTHTFN